MEFLVEI